MPPVMEIFKPPQYECVVLYVRLVSHHTVHIFSIILWRWYALLTLFV